MSRGPPHLSSAPVPPGGPGHDARGQVTAVPSGPTHPSSGLELTDLRRFAGFRTRASHGGVPAPGPGVAYVAGAGPSVTSG